MIGRYAVVGNDKEWETHPLISKNKIPNIISVRKIKRKLDQMNANSNSNNNDNTMTNDNNLVTKNEKTKKQKN
jgi:hypothetical protein